MVTKRIEPMMGVVYIIAQLLGAAVAAYALKAVFPVGVAEARRLGG
jgi:glycerol uptake facilitator-like aquaporin